MLAVGSELTAAEAELSIHMPRERNCVCAVINLLQLACSDYLSTQVRGCFFLLAKLPLQQPKCNLEEGARVAGRIWGEGGSNEPGCTCLNDVPYFCASVSL